MIGIFVVATFLATVHASGTGITPGAEAARRLGVFMGPLDKKPQALRGSGNIGHDEHRNGGAAQPEQAAEAAGHHQGQDSTAGVASGKQLREQVFVTGAAGFIGFHLAKRLKEEGAIVHGIDHFESIDEEHAAMQARRASLLRDAGVIIKHVDVCSVERVLAELRKLNPTKIVHLAAQPGVRRSRDHPAKTIRENVNCFQRLLEVVAAHAPCADRVCLKQLRLR
jgi:hypothetical protein